jgi:malate dehydrogenase (oxaloacetate-decarboxylating)(NADP+)
LQCDGSQAGNVRNIEVSGVAREEDLEVGRVYPELKRIREVSARIGVAVAEVAFESGLAGVNRPASMSDLVESKMWLPNYESFA